MGTLFDKISRAVDAFAEIITEDVQSTKSVRLYTYEELKKYLEKMQKEYPEAAKCTVSVKKDKQFDDIIYSESKYIIKIIMLKGNGSPIYFDENEDSYVGTVIVASAVDKAMSHFMGDKTKKTVMMRR